MQPLKVGLSCRLGASEVKLEGASGTRSMLRSTVKMLCAVMQHNRNAVRFTIAPVALASQAHGLHAGANTPKAGAGFVANAAREMRPVDIVRLYEEEKADLQVGPHF